MQDPGTVVESYIAMGNQPDPTRRRQLAAQTLTEDATSLDPAQV